VVADMADRVAVMYGGWIVEVADVRTLFRGPRHPIRRFCWRACRDST
jgi:ABC-type dipeptide/oligopeptide/nickel transport system ATPase component